MAPTLEGGELLTVEPVRPEVLETGSVVLTDAENRLQAHRIVSNSAGDPDLEIQGDTGWHADRVPRESVLGRVTQSEKDGHIMRLDSRAAYWRAAIYTFTRRASAAVALRLRRTAPLVAFVIGACALFAAAPSAIQAQTDLALSSTASPATVTPGGQITYSQTVQNNGPNAATTAVLYQQTPANTTFTSITAPAGWNCTAPTAGNTGAVTCTDSANLSANTTATFTYVVTVNPGATAGTTIYNWTNVTSQTTDSVPSNNSATVGTLVETAGGADLGVTVSAAPTPVFVTSPLTYTIIVTNYGPAATTASTLTDALPSGFTFGSVAATPSTVSCSGTTTVTCALGAIANGATATITITGTSSGTASTLTNSPALSNTAPTDPYSGNNSATVITVVQPLVCAKPGNDGAAPTFNGIVNAYYPPANTGTLAAASTSIKVGAVATGGATTSINTGDLLLIMQMQAATINTDNGSDYGDGVLGDPAYGSTALNGTGNYEFVTATSSLANNQGGTINISGAGVKGGLLYSYLNNAATSTQGAQTYQVIRVPQYTSATLNSNLEALAWNGTVGGVLAIDVQNQLVLGGTVALDGDGFRGGGGRILGGATGLASTDYISLSTQNANGSKGEGIAGTPAYVTPSPFSSITNSTTATATNQTYVEGIPAGSYARGAPGNAAGGATDGNPGSNNENSGGGAGGNGGIGGNGGFAWSSAGIGGGFGGYLFPATTSALTMGGGGGAGTTNDGSWYNGTTGGADCGTTCTGIYSSGAPGGGIAIIRAGYVTGTGTITSNGTTALSVENDGGGGGGAGGSILFYSNTGTLGGLTVAANGGGGGHTWETQGPGGFPGNRHGPGGGGAGGVIFLSSAPASTPSVAGGTNGYSTTANDSYGATPGAAGVFAESYTITQAPGVQAGAYCSSADLSVTNVGTPNPVSPGGTITYTQVVVNNSKTDAVNAVFSENISQNTTFTSISAPTGWACTTPAVGSTGLITCTDPDVQGSSTGTFTVVTGVPAATASGTQILNTASISSGTTDPNLANNTASVLTLVAASNSADLVVTKTANVSQVSPTGTITYTITVTNNGPATASTNVFTDATPGTTTYNSFTQAGTSWGTCSHPAVGASGTISCNLASFASGATTTFTFVVTVPTGTASGTVITNSANVTSSTADPNPNNNTATASTTVISTTQNNLSVTNVASPYPVYAGNDVTFTQVVTNSGPASAQTVSLTGAIPTGATFVSLTKPNNNWHCTTPAVNGTGNYTCTYTPTSFTSGSTATFTLVVLVPAGTAGGTQISNTATVAEKAGVDISTANTSATASTIVFGLSQADVAIVKSASPNPVDQGTNLTYTLQVTNNGPAAAQNVTVSDPLPTQVTFVSASSSQGTCSQAGGTVNCSLGTVTNGGSVTITINTTASTFSSGGLVANTATVSSTTSDPNLANNISSTITTIVSPTAVTISGFRALTQPGGGVVLEWRTRSELRNLGFHIYREDATGRHQVNPSLIAGAALFARGALPQHAAKTYRWVDPQGTAESTYTLEDVDLSGTHTPHGPVVAEPSNDPTSSQPQATLLAQFNQRYNTAVPARTMPRVVNSTPTLPVPEVASGTLNQMPAAKISVQSEGWYTVSQSQLAAAGFNTSGNAAMLKLYAEGVEQPFLIIGNQAGALGPSDSIQFYGTPIDTPFSGTRVYWLVNATAPGKRILTAVAPTSAPSAPEDFVSTVVLEQRTTYFAALLNGENNDNFFGASVTTEPVDQVLTAAHTDPTSNLPSSIDVTLQGVTAGAPHSITVQLNGSTIGSMEFSGQANITNTFPIQNSLLQEGNNTVTLTANDGENDVSLVQSIALHYPHTYNADAGWLEATAPANTKVSISGFANANVQVFDVTDPLNISALTATVTQSGSAYSVTVFAPSGNAGAPRTLLALSNDQLAQPSAVAFHAPDSLIDSREGADEIIVTTEDFQQSLQPLLSLRQSQSRIARVVLMDQLYDQYNYGERTPYALQEYLHVAHTSWRIHPQDVLLVGTASVDPRNYLGFGYFDFVPTRLIETQAFKTASDDWLSDFEGTGFASMAMGRLPVRTASDASLVISKIVSYEQGSSNGAWNSQALFVADQNVGANFSQAATALVPLLPPAVSSTTILADTLDQATAQQQILTALNSGSVLVNYSGHGAEQQWSFEDLFDDTAAAGLTNGNKLPVYVLMDCLNGFFHDVYAESLSTALMLAPNGGAVAVWASSGFTTQPPQAAMNQAFLSALAANPSTPLGLVTLRAKSGIGDPDVRRTWILFGDPWMRVAFAGSSK